MNTKISDEIRTAHFRKDFWNEIYEGAQIFCISAPGGKYPDHDICKLASFISGMEFHHLSWRATHPYVLVDRFEDVTPRLRLDMNENCNRDVIFYGYLRGCDIKKEAKVHIAGVHDFPLADVTSVSESPTLQHTDHVTDSQTRINIDEHNNLSEDQSEKTIFRMGSYLMFKVCNVPSKMVNNYDPCQPILVGGISPEEDVGCISARFERHGLHLKSLKTKDPIIVSIGWRRYQTTPIY
ncbi:hypothetical protein MKW92_025510, partial [Papaver armeniacum]